MEQTEIKLVYYCPICERYHYTQTQIGQLHYPENIQKIKLTSQAFGKKW